MEILTKSARETAELGEKIANNLKGKEVLCLYGGLGSGKTTFVQGLAKGLGIKKRILSPTFIMMRQYEICDTRQAIGNKKYKKQKSLSPVTCYLSHLYHVDLYRVESEKDVQGLGLSEIFSNPENVVAIEWAEKIKEILPKRRIEVFFEYAGETQRKIKIVNVY